MFCWSWLMVADSLCVFRNIGGCCSHPQLFHCACHWVTSRHRGALVCALWLCCQMAHCVGGWVCVCCGRVRLMLSVAPAPLRGCRFVGSIIPTLSGFGDWLVGVSMSSPERPIRGRGDQLLVWVSLLASSTVLSAHPSSCLSGEPKNALYFHSFSSGHINSFAPRFVSSLRFVCDTNHNTKEKYDDARNRMGERSLVLSVIQGRGIPLPRPRIRRQRVPNPILGRPDFPILGIRGSGH